MTKLICLLVILLAGCTVPVTIVTPPSPPTPTAIIATSAPSATLTLNAAPTVPIYPIHLTVVPRAVSSVNLGEVICRARFTDYRLWPYKLEIVFDDDGYQQCMGGKS